MLNSVTAQHEDATCPWGGPLWVFAYGSLIWNPGFDYLESRIARLDGYRRRFGLYSRHYRGTAERPGLVLGLDWAPGESCTGLALRVCPTMDQAVRAYLAERELVSYAYFETLYPVVFDDGSTAQAICYVLDRSHTQYAGAMDAEAQAKIIATAEGPSGPNRDYLMNTVDRLRAHGIADDHLEQMAQRVTALGGTQP